MKRGDNLKNLQIDPEFKNLIPPLSSDEFKQLEENIRKEGCRDALVVWNEIILDGHNRYQICNKHNIPFATKEAMVEDREEAVIWIIKNQFGRRNLPLHTRVKLAMQLEDTIKAQAKRSYEENVGRPKSLQQDVTINNIHTNDQLGELAGTSRETIRKYKVVQDEGSEELKEKVDKGEKAITTAYRELKGEVSNKKVTKEKPVKLPSVDEINKMFKDMRNPQSGATESGMKEKEKNKELHTPIITELDGVLKYILKTLNKYMRFENIESDTNTKHLIKLAIDSLNSIDRNIKER